MSNFGKIMMKPENSEKKRKSSVHAHACRGLFNQVLLSAISLSSSARMNGPTPLKSSRF